jgi:CubicO group peptidase (beta-lactamase class C family)
MSYLRPNYHFRQGWVYTNLVSVALPLGHSNCSHAAQHYILATHLIEQYSGQNFSTFVQERIFTPLGMKSSMYLPSQAAATGKFSQSWSPSPPRRIPNWFDDNVRLTRTSYTVSPDPGLPTELRDRGRPGWRDFYGRRHDEVAELGHGPLEQHGSDEGHPAGGPGRVSSASRPDPDHAANRALDPGRHEHQLRVWVVADGLRRTQGPSLAASASMTADRLSNSSSSTTALSRASRPTSLSCRSKASAWFNSQTHTVSTRSTSTSRP